MPNRHHRSIVIRALVVVILLVPTIVQASWLDGTVAQLQALDKITARISTLVAPIDEPIRFGTLEIMVRRCAFRPPEKTPENAAFIEVHDRGHDQTQPSKSVFTGWMFSSSPAVSGLEHPVYDITLIDCLAD